LIESKYHIGFSVGNVKLTIAVIAIQGNSNLTLTIWDFENYKRYEKVAQFKAQPNAVLKILIFRVLPNVSEKN